MYSRLDGSTGKRVLKELASRYLGREYVYRPKQDTFYVRLTAYNTWGDTATPQSVSGTKDDHNHEPGEIHHFGGGSVPTGALACDGSSYSTSTYADLFAAIGYTYGGSGSSFKVPDGKGRKNIGKSTNFALGHTDGLTESARTESHNHAHDHGIANNWTSSFGTQATGDGSNQTRNAGVDTSAGVALSKSAHTHTFGFAAGTRTRVDKDTADGGTGSTPANGNHIAFTHIIWT